MPKSSSMNWTDLGLRTLQSVLNVCKQRYNRVYIEDSAHLATEEGRLKLAAMSGQNQVMRDVQEAIAILQQRGKEKAQ